MIKGFLNKHIVLIRGKNKGKIRIKRVFKENLAPQNLNYPQIQKFEGLIHVFLHSSLSAIDKLLCQKTKIKPSNFRICG